MSQAPKGPSEVKLQFDEVRHEYLLGGKPVPSVTKIISSISDEMLTNNNFIRAGIRGTAVHKVCEMVNNGERVNIEALDEDVRRYVEGYLSFRDKEDYAIDASEMRVYSTKYRFAGTMDILATNSKGRKVVMDIKTSAIVSPTTALQLAAYESCYREMFDIPAKEKMERVCIWLTGDGGYQLIHYKEPGDFGVFLCKLASLNWDRKHGLK